MRTLTRRAILCGLIALVATVCVAGQTTDAPEGTPLAWMRFLTGEHVEEFNGTPYLWLGRVELTLTIDVKPGRGHVLDLLWGSKDDAQS